MPLSNLKSSKWFAIFFHRSSTKNDRHVFRTMWNIYDRDIFVKGTWMQIWKSPYMFVFR